MATPTLGGVPTTIAACNGADAGTWTLLTTNDIEFKKEGAGSQSGILRNDLAEGYFTLTSGSVNLANQHVRIWINFMAIPYLDDTANHGMEFLMYDGTNTAYWDAFSKDNYFGGWKNFVLSCEASPWTGSYTKGAVTRWGFRFNRTAAPANKINTWVDYLRYGDGYYATGGTSGDEITLTGIETLDVASGYGIIVKNEGVFFCYGALTLGNGATTTWFKMLNQVLVYPDALVAAGLYKIVGAGSGARVNIDGSVLMGGGTTDATRFILDMDDADLVSCSIVGSLINRAGECRFKSGQTVTGNSFIKCGQITSGGSNFSDCIISGYEGAVNSSVLTWNSATNPDGYLNNIVFTKGTAATHAIEFGTSSSTTITLRGQSFSGYNASNNQNDSVLNFLQSSGAVTYTVQCLGTTGTVSYKTAGAIVNVTQGVLTKVTVKDIDTGSVIVGARVLIKVSSGVNFPYNASVSITGSGTTATVTHNSHGLATNDWVVISGVTNDDDYNGVKQITYVNSNTYTYITNETIGASPAEGATITATFALIHGVTNGSGIISDQRVISNDQPIIGWVRASSGSPYYKQQPILDTVSSSTGKDIVIQLIRDD